MTSTHQPRSSLEVWEARQRDLVARTCRWAVIGAVASVLGLAVLLVAERAGVAWLTVCLATLLCMSWGWALLTLFLGWGGLLLGKIAAGMGQVVAATRTQIGDGSGHKGGGGLD